MTEQPQISTNSASYSAGYEVVDLSKFKSTKEIEKIVSWGLEQHEAAKRERTRNEKQWYLNLAFYFGQQYVQFASTTADSYGRGYGLTVPKAPRWRVRLVSNKIRPIVRTELAKLTAQKPTAYVVPASSDERDLSAAKAGELVWESLYSRKRVHHTLKRALFWTCITGNGFIKTYWDEGLLDPSSETMGDLVFEPENPFALFVPDLVEEDLEQQPFLIHATAKNPEVVSLRYNKTLDGKQLKPDVSSSNEILDSGFLKLVGASTNKKDAVLCLEIWVKPGSVKMFPEGAVLMIVGKQLVQVIKGLPYKHGEYPFAKIDHIPSGKFYADSVVTDLIPLQKEYNRTRSQIIEAKNIMAKPQLLAARGSIDPKKISTEPGQVILYTPGFTEPKPLPLQPLPNYVLQDLDRIQSDIEDISGQHEITRGNAPPGVTAATAISFLQEQDDSKLSHTVTSVESAIEKIARQSLSLVGTYWDTTRVVQVAGAEHIYDAQILKGADLNGNTDIRVEAGSALPQSKAARQAFVMDLMKMGFVDPPTGLAAMDMKGIDTLVEQYEVDTSQARRENVKMSGMEPVAVNTWDNHQAHIMIHNNFRKSQQFEMLPDQIKAAFEQHVQEHMVVASGGMPPQMPGADMQGPPGGGMPPGPGGPPPDMMQPPQGGPAGQDQVPPPNLGGQ
jgi:hypothetical protein